MPPTVVFATASTICDSRSKDFVPSVALITTWLLSTVGVSAPATAPTTKPANGCQDRIVVAAVGDLLMHRELQQQAMAAPDGFGELWTGVADVLAAADVTVANLEGPAAFGLARDGREHRDPGLVFDDIVYTGWNRFNINPSIAGDLRASGFDLVSTANNHALDRGALGIDRTLDALDAAGLAHTGTRRQGSLAPWHTVTWTGGVQIAWLACATHTNHLPDPRRQVLRCSAAEAIVSDLSRRVDAVIVTPHWGAEYVARPNGKQRRLARRWLEAGATAVIGSHPHVLQPAARHRTRDGRDGYVLYSLGNFVSHQRQLPRRTSVVAVLTLSRDAGGWSVVDARYLPITVELDGDGTRFGVVPAAPGSDAHAHVEAVYGAGNLLTADADDAHGCAAAPTP